MTAGTDVRPEVVGVIVGEQRPEERGRTPRETAGQATQYVLRDQIFRVNRRSPEESTSQTNALIVPS